MNDPHAHYVRCAQGESPERGQARAHDNAFRNRPLARPWPRSSAGLVPAPIERGLARAHDYAFRNRP